MKQAPEALAASSFGHWGIYQNYPPPQLLSWILTLEKSGKETSVLPLRDCWYHWKVEPNPTPQTQEEWRTASRGFLRAKCVSDVSRQCFKIKGARETNTHRKMPFGGLAGLKEKVFKPGKEEVKNTVGDSLGKLQRWEGLYGEEVGCRHEDCVCRVFEVIEVVGLDQIHTRCPYTVFTMGIYFENNFVRMLNWNMCDHCRSGKPWSDHIKPLCSQRSWR